MKTELKKSCPCGFQKNRMMGQGLFIDCRENSKSSGLSFVRIVFKRAVENPDTVFPCPQGDRRSGGIEL